jgi:hypothetical protein
MGLIFCSPDDCDMPLSEFFNECIPHLLHPGSFDDESFDPVDENELDEIDDAVINPPVDISLCMSLDERFPFASCPKSKGSVIQSS